MLNPLPGPYKHHHRIQEKIKKRRTNKEAKITFPAEILNSKMYMVSLNNMSKTLMLGREKT